MPGLRGKRSVCSFDSHYVDDPHFEHLEDWLAANQQHITKLLSRFADSVQNPDIAEWIAHFRSKMQETCEKYRQMADYYHKQFNIFHEKSRDNYKLYRKDAEQYDGLLRRLREERLIDYLCSSGVLPSYSFPIYAVELHLPSTLSGQ